MLVHLELLYHFQCENCQQWWSIGDFSPHPETALCCPKCGVRNQVPHRINIGSGVSLDLLTGLLADGRIEAKN